MKKIMKMNDQKKNASPGKKSKQKDKRGEESILKHLGSEGGRRALKSSQVVLVAPFVFSSFSFCSRWFCWKERYVREEKIKGDYLE